jgi:hypothetical protein
MNKIKTMLVTVIAITSLTVSAYSFEGFSIGANYSMTDFSTKGTETTTTGNVLDQNSTSKTGSADYGSLFAEYTFAQGSTLGIEHIPADAEIGKASRTQTNVAASTDDAISGVITVSATVSDHFMFYAEPTFMMNDKFGVYLKGGAARVDVTPKVNESAEVIQSTFKGKEIWGVMQGVGAKYYMGNFFVKAEYTETDYGTYKHVSTTGTKSTVTADIDTEETRFALGYNF